MVSISPPASNAAVSDISPSTSPTRPVVDPVEQLRKLGIHTPASLDSLCIEEGQRKFVLEGLISHGSVNFAAGDSGLGKSPLFYQLGICVAAGLPWLGIPTVQGPVVYLDFENGERDSQIIRDSLVRHLGLPWCPANFLTCYAGYDPRHLPKIVAEIRPALVVVDTLRSHDPAAEENNTKAGEFINRLRALGQQYRTAFQIIHHIKKPAHSKGYWDATPSLENDPVLQWLNQACGARALVNQSDFRMGIDRTAKAGAAMLLRGHVRVRGEFGPFYLTRVLDEDQQPIGYRRISSIELLGNKGQEEAYNKLPIAFSFKEAKVAYERQDEATNEMLKKCMALGIVQKVDKGRYEKVHRTEGGECS